MKANKPNANKKKPKPNKAQARLGRFLPTGAMQVVNSARGITKEGWDWVVQALDPFHDLKHELAGFPDSQSGNSVVRVHQGYFTVGAPGAVPWDCHIFSMPFLSDRSMVPGAYQSGTFTPSGPHTVQHQGLFTAVTSNSPIIMDNTRADVHFFPHTAMPDNCRVIAGGFEVVDTSAEINKQGACTLYRFGNKPVYGNCLVDDEKKMQVDIQINNVAAQYTKWPAKSLSEAVTIPGSVTWEARRGCYVPLCFHDLDIPVQNYKGELRVVTDSMVDPGANYALCSNMDRSGSVPKAHPFQDMESSVQTSGAMFTNLHPSGTLQVRYKIYVEIFPSPADAELTPLSSPSAMLDNKALELYSQVIRAMPVGAPVGDNANGDWFKKIWKVIKSVGDPIATALNGVFPVKKPYDYATGLVDKTLNFAGDTFPFLP